LSRIYTNTKSTLKMNVKVNFYVLCLAITGCGIDVKDDFPILQSFHAKGITLADGQTEEISGFLAPDAVTYIIVRHGEKDLTQQEDPHLTAEGQARAKKIAALVKDLPIYRVCYTSNMKRTLETAEPTIQQFHCLTEQFSKTAVLPFFMSSLEVHKGRCILIVANTNTIPMMLNVFKTGKHFDDIDEKEYDNIFVVTARNTSDATIRQLKY
jgi:2,3-bisphosphoglycerate-dependent phosphoglycerate mutase